MYSKARRQCVDYLVLAAGCLAVASCGGRNGSAGAPAATDFDGFAKTVLTQEENSEPVEVNDQAFVFADEPTAFDDVIQ